jgi:hypothetical protein
LDRGQQGLSAEPGPIKLAPYMRAIVDRHTDEGDDP